MKKKSLSTDSAKRQQLTNILDHATQRGPEGAGLIPAPLIQEISDTIPNLESALVQKEAAITRRRQAILTRNRIMAELKKKLVTYWSVLRHRVSEGKLAPTVLPHYGLEPNGNQPRIQKNRSWITVARQIIQTDEEAETRGIPGIAEPNRESIRTLTDRAEQAILETESAVIAIETIRTQLDTQRPDIDDLLTQIELNLKMNLRKLPAAKKRQYLCILGYQFTNDKPQPTEPDETLEQTA